MSVCRERASNKRPFGRIARPGFDRLGLTDKPIAPAIIVKKSRRFIGARSLRETDFVESRNILPFFRNQHHLQLAFIHEMEDDRECHFPAKEASSKKTDARN
jgi:hypothetical protein